MARAAAKPPANIDELVYQALLAIARADGPVRLTGKGPDVAPAGTGAANKEVLARLRNEVRPLVTEMGGGKTAAVSLTRAGFEQIASRLKAEEIQRVAQKMLDSVPAAEHVTFLNDAARKAPAAMPGLVPLLEAALQAEKTAAEARAREAEKDRATEAATLAALERWKTLVRERRTQRIEALKRELAAEGEQAEDPAPTPRRPPAVAVSERALLAIPDDPDESDFRRNIARRLVSAWIDAWDSQKPDAREFLESAIWNVSGFHAVGEPNQRVSFDGRYHEGGAGLFTNDLVRIVRPGWVLEEGEEREYVVLKAQVTKT